MGSKILKGKAVHIAMGKYVAAICYRFFRFLKYVPVILPILIALCGCGAILETGPEVSGAQKENPNFEVVPVVSDILPMVPEITETAEPVEKPVAEKTYAESMLESMSIEEKIGQLFIYALQNEGYEFTDGMARGLTRYKPAGVILFSEKVGTSGQVIKLIEELKRHSKIPLFVSTDEEGGRVSRVGKLFEMPIGPAGETKSAEEAFGRGAEIGRRLLSLGFNMDLAPVADINSNPQNTVIGDRAFSASADKAAEYVSAFINGMHSEGVLSVIKHFPGHGDTVEDSHQGAAVFKYGKDRLFSSELKPFIKGIEAGADAVMVGHISAPNITGDSLPATFSPVMVTQILRGELGYDGLVITDAMNMGAVTNYYGPGEAAILALEAGVDIILMPADMEIAYEAVMGAYKQGRLSEGRINESVLRALKVKEKLAGPEMR
ncbi:MAG: glycoside hydrolase family 3 protein [Clostridiales bacterium]|nr:glycoside hydrolase family 3 protein [Clostridiales bacterium]